MLEFTPLAATESVSPSGNGFIRVFYQSEDNCIREACYEDTHGWYSTDADVVVKAKKNTPIAAVSLDNGASVAFHNHMNLSNSAANRSSRGCFITSTRTIRFARLVFPPTTC